MNQPQMYESTSISVFSNMAAYRAGFEDDEDSCMWCLDTAKYRCLRCKFPLCKQMCSFEKTEGGPSKRQAESKDAIYFSKTELILALKTVFFGNFESF